MQTVIRRVRRAYRYKTERRAWKSREGRKYCILALSLSGRYDHTVDGKVLPFEKGDLFFLRPDTQYTVRCVEQGESLCVTFLAETDLPSGVWNCGQDAAVTGAFRKLMGLGNLMREENECLAAAALCEIFAAIARRIDTPYRAKSTREKLRLLHDAIVENCTDPEFDLDAAESLCGLGKKRLGDLFRQEYGITPTQYRIALRLDQAETLLSQGGMTVTEVARHTGFEDVFYFSRLFKKRFALSPTAYRKSKE